jgi:multiple sugar transport system substrate-binding protein
MRNMFKTVTRVLAILALLALVVGCGGQKGPVTVKFTYWGSPDEKAAVDASVKSFEAKYPKIKVNSIHIGTDYDTKITTMVAANEAPDMGYMESATLLFPLAEQGKLANLQERFDKDKAFEKKILPNLGYFWEPGKMAGLGFAPEMFTLYYNEEMFQQAGVETPPAKVEEAWEWDKFVEVAKLMTIDQNGKNASQPGFDPKKIKQFGFDFSKWWGNWGNFVYANGGDFVLKDGKTLGLTQPEAMEALQRLADLINVYHVAPSPVQSKALPGTTAALQSKKIAMVVDGQWVNLDLGNAKFPYNVGALPKMKTSTTQIVAGAMSIFSSSKYQDEAWTMFKFLIDPEQVRSLIVGGLWMPAYKEWYTDEKLLNSWAVGNAAHPSGYKDSVLNQMLNYSVTGPTYYVKNYNKIMDIINPALDKVWLGTASVKDAFAAVADKAQAEVQGRRDIK